MFRFRSNFSRRVSLLAAASLLFAAPANAVRTSTMSGVRSISSPVTFGPGGIGRFAGGVVQEGIVEHFFLDSDGVTSKVELEQISFVTTGDGIYPFGLQYAGVTYLIPLGVQKACPIANFVSSGQTVLFTIPPIAIPDDKLQELQLQPVGDSFGRQYYSHAAFAGLTADNGSEPLVGFLEELDLSSSATSELSQGEEWDVFSSIGGSTVPYRFVDRNTVEIEYQQNLDNFRQQKVDEQTWLSNRLAQETDELARKAILEEQEQFQEFWARAEVEYQQGDPARLSDEELESLYGEEIGSYLNNDLHTIYEVYLAPSNEVLERAVVDMAGLPLRYFYAIRSDGSLAVSSLSRFDFPELGTEQHDYVIFYQNLALLRTMKREKLGQFESVREKVCG